jgi:hypothetical protein
MSRLTLVCRDMRGVGSGCDAMAIRCTQLPQHRRDSLDLSQPRAPRGVRLCRVSDALDQARFAFDKRLADRFPLLVVEFKSQVIVPGPLQRRLQFESDRT